MFNVAAHGHVQPSLEVIRELVARGHRVTYAIAEEFAELVASTGAEPRVHSSSLPPKDDTDAWGTELTGHLRLFLAEAGRALPQLTEAYGNDRPDLVLHDPVAYAGRVLADRWGVPAVQVSPTAVAWEGYEDDIRDGTGPDAAAHGWLGAAGLAAGRAARRPERCVVVISKVLQPHADRVDGSVYSFTGPCRGSGTDRDDWRRPPHAERVVLVSLGTIFTRAPALYRACLAAFGGLPGWHVVLQTGGGIDPADLGELPDNVELRGWIPQLSIMDRVDAFITHAGPGSIQVALAHGVPMVAVPQAADQFGNARMLQELGVAHCLGKDEVTAEALREAVCALVDDPEMAARGASVRREMAAEGGTRRAADLIEAALPARDKGTTALGDMSRTAKTDLRIAAYADANEANA
ncbi:macrolide family glycosyltransferase, partial [Streptomyces sp. NPDC000229]|uniref:macrolide family glycosyltransferase n=1 Tax=Streptomyces sp. NPDC000229 TaxID=3154247 RepID=UPI00332C536B